MIGRLKPKSKFSRNVLTLMTGTTIAQGLSIAVTPILSRIYSPHDFGIFALYIAVISIGNSIATGRYELAIMMPQKDTDAANIVMLSILVALGISTLMLFGVIIFNSALTTFFGDPEISDILYFAPLAVLLTGIYQSFNYWCNRKKYFKTLSNNRVLQGSGSAAGQVSFGVAQIGPTGLVAGSIAAQLLGVGALAKRVRENDKKEFEKVSVASIIYNAKLYFKYPVYSAFGALVNNAGTQAPIFIITKFFNTNITGMFSLCQRVLTLPMGILASSISQVLFQKISEMNNNEPEKLFGFIVSFFMKLVIITIPFVLVSAVWGGDIFVFILGDKWYQAGEFTVLVSLVVAVRFAVSPLSYVLLLDQNIKLGVYWQMVYCASVITTLLLARNLDIDSFLKVFVVHEFLLYGLHLAIILYASKYRVKT